MLVMFVCSALLIAFFWERHSSDRAIRVHLATWSTIKVSFLLLRVPTAAKGPGAPEQAGKTHRIPIDKYERTKKIVCTAF